MLLGKLSQMFGKTIEMNFPYNFSFGIRYGEASCNWGKKINQKSSNCLGTIFVCLFVCLIFILREKVSRGWGREREREEL